MKSNSKKPYKITIAAFQPPGIFGVFLNFFSPLLDLLLGIKKINKLYQKHIKPEMSVTDFLDKSLAVLNIRGDFDKSQLEQIPKTGPVLIAANHPLGGLEGLLLAYILLEYRSDVKFIANIALSAFRELTDLFIFTNPLMTSNSHNVVPVKRAVQWMKEGHVLMVFPAGRVSFYQKEIDKISDGDWQKLVAILYKSCKSPVVPLYIHAQNSKLFYFLGRIY
ncbi:MAG: 1-acyl-sn-glycerol-3-phosphate acyltransferase, partial [Spirochaetes bacterium]|nr:1-acyl-sn-glycerol-3-phosphate acyltransferase [Spirochaetota bacterium]